MNRSLRRQFLEADLAQVEDMLRSIPERHVIERLGFKSRREEILAELRSLDRPGTSANVVLAFDGDPVHGAPGIDAKFAGSALTCFQDLVSGIDASKSRGLGSRGRVPAAQASSLRVVGTVVGSFGFELQEVANPLIVSSLADSVDRATRLIAAAGSGDEAFFEAISEIDARVQGQLGAFLKTVRSSHATCKLIADNIEASLDGPRIEAAVERVKTTKIDEKDEEYEGKFLGVILESRLFEHEISDLGAVIKGKVDDDVDRETMIQWNRKYTFRNCIALVHRKTVSRLSKTSSTYTLLKVDPVAAR